MSWEALESCKQGKTWSDFCFDNIICGIKEATHWGKDDAVLGGSSGGGEKYSVLNLS